MTLPDVRPALAGRVAEACASLAALRPGDGFDIAFGGFGRAVLDAAR